MLPKKFVVTRHGRVVFYDYDEIWYLMDLYFRALTQSDPENVMVSSDAFLSVGEKDFFPEQFKQFVYPEVVNQGEFWPRHPEIADSQFWQLVQSRMRTQELLDIYPCR
jgi:isocitrate dehydrogenase kinase/phosphatase